MSGDPGQVEVAADSQLETGNSQPRAAGKGPFILAKVIVSYLAKKKQGYCADYSELVEKLSCQTMSEREMGKWLRALKLCVSQLNQDCELLVVATLRLPWFTQSQALVELYLDYLANLLSAQVCHVEQTLSTLTKALLGVNTLTMKKGSDVEEMYGNIHRALKTLLDTIPRVAPQLVPALSKHYPFRTRGPDVQEVAVRNCLHVTTYCPTITEDILYLLINKMITIDAEIRVDDDASMELVNEEENTEGDLDTQFHVDVEQELTTMAPAAPSTVGRSSGGSHLNETTPTNDGCRGEEATPPHLGPRCSARRVMQSNLSESLDIHMRVLQCYTHSSCFQSGKFATAEAVSLLQTLLKIFSDVILPTHAISHVQFLLFYVTSFHEEFPGFFLDFLWKKFEDFGTSAVLRQTTAAYMASYVARSKFVALETARVCLIHMMQWLHQYLDMCDPSSLGLYVAQHGPFFSLCQAVFYIFVFRHQSLVDMENGLSFLRNLNFERIISSKLNPLKVCLPSVVEKFSKIASQHEVVFCYTILEENKRLMLILQASLGAQGDAHTSNLLDCFFPFDPYWLQRSREVIHPLYQEWEEEEEEEREGREEDEVGDTEDMSSLLSSSCLSVSLEASYETTPTHATMPTAPHTSCSTHAQDLALSPS